jgi:integrase
MGYVFQRGNIWWFQFYQDGQRVRMSSDSESESVARQRLKEHEARVTLQEPVVPRAGRVTYDELRADLLAHYQSTGTRAVPEATRRLRHVDRAFRGCRAAALTGPVLAKYIIARQQAGAANGTVNRELGILVKMLRLGVEHHKVVRLPIVHLPKEAAPRAGFFERAQFLAVRAELPADLQVAVTIAFSFGWRTQSEVLTLERRQIDLTAGKAGTLRLDPGQTKNNDGRVVYLTPELRDLLEAHLGRVAALEKRLGRVIPWVFPLFTGAAQPNGQTGRHRAVVVGERRQDFRLAWATACRRAGLAGMIRHDFRRTAVRDMVNGGVPERVAMAVTGHKTRSVFDRYHIVSPADLQAAAEKIGAAATAVAPATISATVTPVTPLRRQRRASHAGT